MQSIEKAIRQTFLKINVHDKEMRQRVYQMIWQVYKKSLQQHTKDETIIESQKQKFDVLVVRIEAEFSKDIENSYPLLHNTDLRRNSNPACLDDVSAAEEIHSPQEVFDAHHINSAPAFEKTLSTSEGEKLLEPALAVERPEKLLKDKPLRKKRKKRSFFRVLMFLWLSISGVSAYVLYSNLFGIGIKVPDKEQSRPPETLFEEITGIRSEKDADTSYKWRRLLSAKDFKKVLPHGNVILQIKNNKKEEAYLQAIVSRSSDAILIPLDETILQDFQGQSVVFDLLAREAKGNVSQISISCDFGKGNSCGKHRFDVPLDRDDLLFPAKIPINSSEPLKLRIESGIKNKGYGIDIFSLLIRPAKKK